jgi:hypothetical protein
MIVKRFQSLLVLVFALGIPWAASGMEADERVPPAVQRQMEGTRSKLLEWLMGVDREAFRPGKFLARDEAVLKGGTTLLGKILDYGPTVCFIDESQAGSSRERRSRR